jgi:hypothetical protein
MRGFRTEGVRHAKAYRAAAGLLFGATRPKEGKAVGLILPWCNTAMMNLHLAAVSADIAPGRHAVLLLDQAGWHISAKLAVPDNITIVPLPPKCPELNAQENVWQFMRDNWLTNRVFNGIDALLDHCCDAWTSWRLNLGPSCPSDSAIGRIGSDQRLGISG